MQEITVRYRWSLQEITEANRWHRRQRTVGRIIYCALLVVASICLVVALYFYLDGLRHPTFSTSHSESSSWLPISLLVYLVVLFFLRRLMVSWRLRRSYAKSPARDSEVEWQITEDTLRTAYVHGSSEQAWSAFYKAVLTPKGLLLYPQPQVYQWLPRHAFHGESEFNWVAETAQRRIPAFRRLL